MRNTKASVANLPSGHRIDLECKVRYGLIGEPVAAGADKWDEVDALMKRAWKLLDARERK